MYVSLFLLFIVFFISLVPIPFFGVQPIRYGFEGLMINEFRTLDGACNLLVPQGPGYENVSLDNQVCSTVGSQAGQPYVNGNAYLQLSFGFSSSMNNLWRASYSNFSRTYNS